MESILTTVKKLNNVADEYDVFDVDFITHINSVFMSLWQMGVGPKTPFYIEGKDTLWNDFVPTDNPYFNAVKSYIAMKVGMLFDPPSNGTLNSSKEKQIAELEWRLNFAAESGLLSSSPVVGNVDVERVTLNHAEYTMKQNSTMTLVATIIPFNATNRNLIWSSSDETIISVTDGYITALRGGIATVTVTTEDGGYTAKCVFEVIGVEAEPYYILEKLNVGSHNDWEPGSTAGSQYWLYDHADSLSKLKDKTITHIGFFPGVNSDHTLYVYDVDLSKKSPPTNWTLHGTYVVSDCVKGVFKEVDIDDFTVVDGHTIGIKGYNACTLKEEDGSNVTGLPRTSYTSDTAVTGTTATNAHWDFKVQ